MKQELATQTGQFATTTRGIQFSSLDDMLEVARIVVNSGLAPRGLETPERIFIALQSGAELGLSPMQSLQSIAVINNRPCVYGDGAAALVKAHPQFEDMVETFERGEGEENMLAKCVVMRKGKIPVERTFSIAEAKKAGLWGKSGPWTQYPKRMLSMRARSFAMRDAFPDALKGVGIREEVEDYAAPKPANARVVSTGITLPKQERGDETCAKSVNPTSTQNSPSEGGGDVQPVAAPESGEFQWEGDK